MTPVQDFEACFQFLVDLANYFVEVRERDIKNSLANLFVEILLPLAAVISPCTDRPCSKAVCRSFLGGKIRSEHSNC